MTDYVHLWIFGRSASADPNLPHKPFDNNKTLSDKQRALLINELPNSLPAQVVDSISELVTTSIDSLAAQNLANKGLKTLRKGRIYIDSRPVQKVSSTKIRTQLLTDCTAPIIKDSLLNHCEYLSKHLHPAVYNYIVQHKLYSAD